MSTQGYHPKDLSPYLDRDISDCAYEEIKLHLETCDACRGEAQSWRMLEGLFRAPDLEVDVPPYQWQSIRARLELPREEPWWKAALLFVSKPGRLAYGISSSLILLFALTFGVREYRIYSTQQQMTAIAAYTQSERHRLDTAANPFSDYADTVSDNNPFSIFQTPDTGNPFAVR